MFFKNIVNVFSGARASKRRFSFHRNKMQTRKINRRKNKITGLETSYWFHE